MLNNIMDISIKVKRIYDEYEESDGFRILVDRLWPRGLKKEEAKIDLWIKEIAPSDELRKWFAHDPSKWEELYSAKDREHNNAIILKNILESIIK